MTRLALLRPYVLAAGVILALSATSLVLPAEAAGPVWEGPVLISGDDPLEVYTGSAVAADSSGNAIAVWSNGNNTNWSSGTIWANRFWPGYGWGVPEQIAGPLEVVYPVGPGADVAVDSEGAAVAVWSGNGSIWASSLYRLSRVPTYEWAPPLPIRGQGGFARSPQIAMDSSGRALVAWGEYNQTGTSVWASIWTDWFVPQEGWGEPTRMGGGEFGGGPLQVAASQTGSGVVIWEEVDAGNATGRLMANSFVPGLGWGSAVRIDVEGCPWGARLAVSPAGDGVIVWMEGGWAGCQLRGPVLARSFTADGRWSAAAKGPNGTTPDVAVDEAGNALVVWRTGDLRELWVSQFLATTGWGSSTQIPGSSYSGPTWSNYSEVHHFEVPPRIAISETGGAMVVFHMPYNESNNLPLRLAASWSLGGGGWSEPAVISIGPLPLWEEVALDPSGDAIVVWIDFETIGVNEWRAGIWANSANGDPLIGLEQRLRDLENSLAATNAMLAQLSAQLLQLFVVFVTTVAALVILLGLSLRRRGFGAGLEIRKRGARSEAPHAPASLPSQEGGRAESQATPQSPLSSPNPPHQAEGGSPPATSIRLTAKERILLHLLRCARYADELEVPLELTQEGIAGAAWIDHRHFAQYAGPLVRDGLIRERTAHVRNGHQRRRVYDLTEIGKRVALRLQARAKSEVVRVWDGEHVWDVRVGDVLQKLNGKVSVLDIVRHLTEAGVVDFAALGVNREGMSAEVGNTEVGDL